VTTDFERHRLASFFTKEPETIRWIDELMGPGDTFFDIGANVGVFTLYAAVRHGARLDVRAFEPAHHNYHRLCRNVAMNRLTNVAAYCVALGERAGARRIELASNDSGSASHGFEGDSSRPGRAVAFSQGSLTLSLDELISAFGLPRPQHLKIDVDGYEESILAGGRSTLAAPWLRSVLVEVTDEGGSKERILRVMTDAGFETGHPLNTVAEHSRARRARGGTSHIENVIFTR
jgi:FkbM family methyltransferase